MPSRRQLHLGAFMRPASIHTGAWRYPGAWPDMNFNFTHIKRSIQTLERAKFDAFFMADHMAVLNMPMDALKRSHTSTSFEPFTLLSALSQATERIGLVATGSTTFDAPYNIARPVQGWPVIVQAGASDVGRQLAAETAEMVFTALPNMKAGQAFCTDVKARMKKAGRNPQHMTIMPACLVMLGETVEEAKQK